MASTDRLTNALLFLRYVRFIGLGFGLLLAYLVQTFLVSKNPLIEPTFKGGLHRFYSHLHKNTIYPEDAKLNSIEGKVIVQFIIDERGNVMDSTVKIVEGVYPSLDQEAVRLVKESPDRWKPGKNKRSGEYTKVRMTLPVIFKLSKTKDD